MKTAAGIRESQMPKNLYVRAAELLEAEIDEDIVGLDRSRGECFGFNAVASDVWRLLKQPVSERDILAKIREEYEVSDEESSIEIAALLDRMMELKLVKRVPD